MLRRNIDGNLSKGGVLCAAVHYVQPSVCSPVNSFKWMATHLQFLTSSNVVWLTEKCLILKAALLASRRSNIFATPPAETGTWYSTMLKCWSCRNRNDGVKLRCCCLWRANRSYVWLAEKKSEEELNHGRMKGQRVYSLPLSPKECYRLVLTSVSPLGVLVGFETGRW